MKKILNILIFPLIINFSFNGYSEKYDIDLSKLGEYNPNGVFIQNNADFRKLTEELGVALSPKILGPAESLGGMVIDVGYEISFTNINGSASYWKNPTDGKASDLLTTMQVKLRKGLPYSLEIGGNITHLFQSPMWGVGVEIKWAVQEGFKYIPDFAIRGNINTVLGEHDLAMLIGGFDIISSKTFGVFGLFSVAPYAGYNMIYINASSHILGRFNENKSSFDSFVFPQQGIFKHRGIIGFRIIATYISFAGEVAITEGLQTYTLKLGIIF